MNNCPRPLKGELFDDSNLTIIYIVEIFLSVCYFHKVTTVQDFLLIRVIRHLKFVLSL